MTTTPSEHDLQAAGWRRRPSGRWIHPRLNAITPGTRARLVTLTEAVAWYESWQRQEAHLEQAEAASQW